MLTKYTLPTGLTKGSVSRTLAKKLGQSEVLNRPEVNPLQATRAAINSKEPGFGISIPRNGIRRLGSLLRGAMLHISKSIRRGATTRSTTTNLSRRGHTIPTNGANKFHRGQEFHPARSAIKTLEVGKNAPLFHLNPSGLTKFPPKPKNDNISVITMCALALPLAMTSEVEATECAPAPKKDQPAPSDSLLVTWLKQGGASDAVGKGAEVVGGLASRGVETVKGFAARARDLKETGVPDEIHAYTTPKRNANAKSKRSANEIQKTPEGPKSKLNSRKSEREAGYKNRKLNVRRLVNAWRKSWTPLPGQLEERTTLTSQSAHPAYTREEDAVPFQKKRTLPVARSTRTECSP